MLSTHSKFLGITFLIALSACTSNQAPTPASSLPYIPNLSIVDSLDFGVTTMGIAKSLVLEFQNVGADTIRISSQSISDSSFSLADTSQKQMAIAPGAKKFVTINFVTRVNGPHIGFDTIRSQSNYFIVILKGSGNSFSTMFPIAPSSISLSLIGLLGYDSAPLTPGIQAFNFNFSTNTGPQHWSDTMYFTSTSGYSFDGQTNGGSNSTLTKIWVQIDTLSQKITWLKALSESETDTWLDNNGHRTDGGATSNFLLTLLELHDIALIKGSDGWSAVLVGMKLNSIVTSATYQGTYELSPWQSQTTADLTSITGYEDTASLNITIR